MDFTTIVIGVTFLAVATSWSVLTDRAGKPGVKSTHELIQAYLTSISKNDPSEVENLIEKRSNPQKIITSQIRLHSKDNNDDFRLVLPDVHPGPFHPVGGSNIPYRIYEHLNSSAMVMHSVSDHSLNIPSQTEVENYLKSLTNFDVSNKGITCTEPVTVQINKSRTVGLLFDKTAILFFSLSPYGMEDLPSYVKCEIEQYAKNRKFDRVLVVDCHNAMGEEISKIDSEDLLNSAKSTLDTLMSKKSYPIEFGYANSKDMDIKSPDLGLAGLGILCLKINNEKYFLGWADANNMENGVREQVVSDFAKHGFTLLEICTSDTHYTNTAKIRNRNGYYQFGKVSIAKNISSWYLDIAKQAEAKITPGSFEILEHKSTVMIMGPTIFEDYSKALDRCMKLTKIFLIGSMAFFLSTLTPLF